MIVCCAVLKHVLLSQRGNRILAGMNETVLDVKGMNCPLPVLKANRVLRGMAAGSRLRVLATDRAAVADFQAFCRETGHALLAWSEEAGIFNFLIRRRPDAGEISRPDAGESGRPDVVDSRRADANESRREDAPESRHGDQKGKGT